MVARVHCRNRHYSFSSAAMLKAVLLIFLVNIALVGCGGGGSSNGDNTPNELPVSSFTMSEDEGLLPLTISFDASGSTDSDGSISSYEWSFGDGGISSGAMTSHVFDSIGEFEVSLTVTDNEGSTSVAMRTVSVRAAPIAHIIELL